MTARPFKFLLSYEEALKTILDNIKAINRVEEVDLEKCFRRILAEELRARISVPSFDRAAMDGYALKAEDTYKASSFNPRTLKLIEVLYAGDRPRKTLKRGECIQIATGCPIPKGANAVVMLEFTKRTHDYIKVLKPVYAGANISWKGEDIQEGDLILNHGAFITPAKAGVLAALGRKKVRVYERPRIAVIPTGTEICEVGSELGASQVYDINSYTLAAMASENGALIMRSVIIPDTKEDLEVAIKEFRNHDLVVIAGGSSVGERDLLSTIVRKLGTVLFHGVQVKPGKPTLFGLVYNTPLLGMPGYPTSCLSNAYLFLMPAIRKLARFPPKKPNIIKAKLAERVISSSGRLQFLTVKLREGFVYPVFKHSGAITSMAEADGYIVLPTNVDVIEKGDEVSVILLND